MIDEDGITKDLSDKHCAMLQKPPEKEKCDASRICLTPGIQRHKPLLIKKNLKYRRLILLTDTYTTVNPLLSPPGGLFFSSTFEGGLNREGGLI